ncbi:hypothetical protein Pla175_33690 [Pirellulimonas nuda]|uniref:Sulfatase n=1 Tax=Pirellulimonas nuda TaxID=2528009 RepID=A0A518DER8_9BACT|nr:DUF1501 domain-containing protein [Pirellulimonas nuda]QDU89971.1 hypothetical protein Pla175_33690 [Pirellulimonas nuda]
MTRRHFFRRGALGLGGAALASLSNTAALGAASPAAGPGATGLSGLPHFAAKAKRVIYLFMAGGPSQLDLFDYKPKTRGLFDQDLPPSVYADQRLTTMTSGQARLPIAPSKYRFSQHGQNGAWVSELLPYTAKMTDDMTIVRSVYTEAINHDPAMTFVCTGDQLPGRASLGSWLSYGLGTENQDLPAFVVMTPSWTGRTEAQSLYSRLWGSGFLPSTHQGVALRSGGDPVLFLNNPAGIDTATRRRLLDRISEFNHRTLAQFGDPETQTRIDQYEMAFRMQASVPELTDTSDESEQTLNLYGPDVRRPGTFAASCLLARRMTERGVRFVQIFHRGWDQHGNVGGDLPNQCRDIDQASWALVQDLKNRGLLEDTLVVWGGEFGRTIYCQGKLSRDNYGRDHHAGCSTMWLAGGGVRPGLVHGETDDFGYNVTRDPVHVQDLNATILHCMGIDNQRMVYPTKGLDMRLTGVKPHGPVHEILS